MAIDDNTTYGLKGSQIKDVAKGLIKTLTTADYNYPTTNPQYIALWLLPEGVYKVVDGTKVRYAANQNDIYASYIFMPDYNSDSRYGLLIGKDSNSSGYGSMVFEKVDNSTIQPVLWLKPSSTWTNNSFVPLSAAQGVVLKNSIGDLTTLTTTAKTSAVAAINELAGKSATSGNSAPTTATEGEIGQLYVDTSTGDIYYLESIDNSDPSNPVYTWTEFGGGVNVVQTTGTSTTDVMSQNAVTGMVFADPEAKHKVRIGTYTGSRIGGNSVYIGNTRLSSNFTSSNAVFIGYAGVGSNMPYEGAIAIGGNANVANSGEIAIGRDANAGAGLKTGSIALGAYSSASAQGEMNIGSSDTSYGYNSSNYRLLTGLYDPQSAHDAATKGYVDNAVGSTISDEDYNDLWS